MLPLSVSGAIKMVLVSEAWSSLLLCSQRRFGAVVAAFQPTPH
jgi:hypothetical protein